MEKTQLVDRKEYLFQTTVIEARNLKIAKDSGLADIFVKISFCDKQPQSTLVVRTTNSAEWNQSFTIPNIKLSTLELQNKTVMFQVFRLSKVHLTSSSKIS